MGKKRTLARRISRLEQQVDALMLAKLAAAPPPAHGTDWSNPNLSRGLEELSAIAMRPRPFGHLG
jgi:hypothetical protein